LGNEIDFRQFLWKIKNFKKFNFTIELIFEKIVGERVQPPKAPPPSLSGKKLKQSNIHIKITKKMEDNRRNEIVSICSFGQEDATVRASMEVGGKYKFTKIGEPQVIGNGTNAPQWVPVEDSEGHCINMAKLIRSKGLKWSSNKVADRVDAIIKAVESNTGLPLEVEAIGERESRDRNRQTILDEQGKPVMTKVYTFKSKLVG